MIEAQWGAAVYHLHPKNNCVIEWQPFKGARWRTHSRWRDETEAQDALWRLARGEQVETMQTIEQREGKATP